MAATTYKDASIVESTGLTIVLKKVKEEQKEFKSERGWWAGKITSAESWKDYLDRFSERLRSPLEITVTISSK